ncbi:Dihydrodipicolinate reductase [Halanaerobium saccharolyticum subsp. saccharolyticum DSM 6643]|uniref:4-hydroxy-tetrahydrodipicolinate reductase n=1 Tax=Halanaerobium saccharolyticum subsp. saccharolyticum DSM 6643 TaxID=1293054 RepID=M5E4X7_9FIRM|nr:dihydrodipicolinate reductase C-terminal domain-containing protein [Halanaerobium saccharolyticum]CCU81124.1 Dihydrodipicolinate reductase [Halanaerobium saccharolyticum subsp. saccharolyticum DSM 6643]
MKYGIIGYSGRMGQAIEELFSEAGHQLVYQKDEAGEKELEKPEVIIDFSLKEAFAETVKVIEQKQVALVIGTTGLDQDDFAELKRLAEEVPVIQSFNFSIGINILSELINKVNQYVDQDWDIEISETHHRFKKDKPSGTAIMLGDLIDRDELEMHSKRLGSEFGEHEVDFASTGEVLTLKHRAYSREAFTRGVLISAEAALDLDAGFYTFKDILN